METKAFKVDEQTIRVTKTIPEQIIAEKVEERTYDIEYLVKQREQIQKDYDRDAATLALRQAELDEVDALIAQAKEVGVEPIIIKEVVDVGTEINGGTKLTDITADGGLGDIAPVK
jgi:hypothetical protein